MPKVQSMGNVEVDTSSSGLDKPQMKSINLKDYDDSASWTKAKDDKGFYKHMNRKGEAGEYSCKDGDDILNPSEELKERK